MSTANTYKVAILSLAHVHAASYARLLNALPGVELRVTDPETALYGPSELRGRALADDLGVEYADDYDDIFAWRPDAVIVTSENARHRELVERAAAVGAHVLCEKPLATTEEDAQAMIQACDQAGVVLMTAYPVRFSPEFQYLREIVRSGELGQILTVTGTNNGKIPLYDRAWFTNPELAGGGALVDHVVHIADLLDVLLGEQDAVSVRAVSNRILHAEAGVETETGGLVAVAYPGGVNAVIDCSWSQPDAAPNWGGLTLEVVGSRGTAQIAPFSHHVGGFAGDHPAYLGFDQDTDQLMLTEFLEAARTGRRGGADGPSGLRSLRIALAAQKSAREGTPVAVSPDVVRTA